MAATVTTGRVTPVAARVAPPIRLEVRAATARAGTAILLRPVTFRAGMGEIVAIAGGSGAGKSTLLDVIAGRRRADRGSVYVDGRRVTDDETVCCGYVPQDDIIHTDLPLARSLEHTAALRLAEPNGCRRGLVVRRTLDAVGLTPHADSRVGSLSGGQRKRACIAAELLPGPDLLLLDEPTAGLDPATAADVMGHLRDLAESGATIVMTTHSPADLARCDRIVFLAPGGTQVFTGTPDEALRVFDVDRLDEVYERLGRPEILPSPATSEPTTSMDHDRLETAPAGDAAAQPGRSRAGWWRQWRTSTVRTAELILRNRLTLAILFGSPLAVIGMLAVLFRPGAVETDASVGTTHLVFWIVFSAFFFGMTYGLLQIVTERAIFDRERAAGLRASAFVAAKVSVLLPFLAAVDAAMLWILDANGQLPDTSRAQMLTLWFTLALTSAAALAVGLAASALVRTASQATLALPMLCFPQVLFAGAIVPVVDMALPGRALSALLVGRWGFDAFGRTFASIATDRADWVGSGRLVDGSVGRPMWMLVAMFVAATAATMAVLGRR